MQWPWVEKKMIRSLRRVAYPISMQFLAGRPLQSRRNLHSPLCGPVSKVSFISFAHRPFAMVINNFDKWRSKTWSKVSSAYSCSAFVWWWSSSSTPSGRSPGRSACCMVLLCNAFLFSLHAFLIMKLTLTKRSYHRMARRVVLPPIPWKHRKSTSLEGSRSPKPAKWDNRYFFNLLASHEKGVRDLCRSEKKSNRTDAKSRFVHRYCRMIVFVKRESKYSFTGDLSYLGRWRIVSGTWWLVKISKR